MKPFFVLLGSFLLCIIIMWFVQQNINYSLANRIAMAIMLFFTATGHFAFTRGMAMMIPAFVPLKNFFVYATGVFELMLAAGLLIPSLKALTGIVLILFFILIMPANIYAAIKKVDYQKGDYTGAGLRYLWLRVPMQLFFIAWVYFGMTGDILVN